MVNRATQLIHELSSHADPKRANLLQRFFKTGPGEYGAGDRFLGLTVPLQRHIAQRYSDLSFRDFEHLLQSPWHEVRLTALIILVDQARRAMAERLVKEQNRICTFYLAHSDRVNNWDLVDTSAPSIVGPILTHTSNPLLTRLARSRLLWDRRIAVLATSFLIKQGLPGETLRLTRLLLQDPEPLMHKAIGWMLREVGKCSGEKVLRDFLDRHGQQMPRTMLRYAIEKFPESVRKRYLRSK